MSSKAPTSSNKNTERKSLKSNSGNHDASDQQQIHQSTNTQRVALDPNSLTPGMALRLQRTVGNRVTGRLLARRQSTRLHETGELETKSLPAKPPDPAVTESPSQPVPMVQRKIGPGYPPGKFVKSKLDFYYRVLEEKTDAYNSEDSKGRQSLIAATNDRYDRTEKQEKDLTPVSIPNNWHPWVPKDKKSATAAAEVTIEADKVDPLEYTKLAQYKRINVIDLGGPGSGHQAAVIKLLKSIAKVGYNGSVILTYNAKKTRIYIKNFGDAKTFHGSPSQSYNLYHKEWEGKFPKDATGENQLTIKCRPLGGVNGNMSATEERVFGSLENFWQKFAWPGAPAPEFNEPPPKGFGREKANWTAKKKWSKSNNDLGKMQDDFRKKIYEQETGAGMVSIDDLKPLEKPSEEGARTLTAFGAMDFHARSAKEAAEAGFKETYFEKHWLPALKKMTGEDDPVSIILQPFLWTGGHPMQVRGGGKEPVDIASKITETGGKAAYGFEPPPPEKDREIIGNLDEIPKAVLEKAMAGQIHLVSAYYGGPVSKISYPELLKVLVKVFKQVSDDKPVTIALLGDEEKTAHIDAAKSIQDPTVGAKESAKPTKLKIELAHIGRTSAFAQFQRYSELFIAEGANTWQELLTIGTPALSSNPEGNTQPWQEEEPSSKGSDRAKMLVANASQALIGAQSEQGDQEPNIKTLVDFIKDVRSEDSVIQKYFQEWSTALGKSESDQVIAALQNLPDV